MARQTHKPKRPAAPAPTAPPEDWKPSPLQRAFLRAYSQCGIITASAELAGVHPDTPRGHWKDVRAFAEAMTRAKEEADDRLETEALRRAVEGVDEPVFHKGKVCGKVRRYSDGLLQALLRANRPGKFRESVDHTHTGNVTLKMYGQETPLHKV